MISLTDFEAGSRRHNDVILVLPRTKHVGTMTVCSFTLSSFKHMQSVW